MEPDFDGVPLDTRTIPQSRLNIDHKSRSNPFPWNGQFSPQLVETLLAAYAPGGGVVLDPFVGSGTVLLEAARLGHAGFGTDVDPAALKMAEVYGLINVATRRRSELVVQADELVHGSLPDDSLFSTGRKDDGNLKELLSQAANAAEPMPVKALLDALIILLDFDETPLMTSEVCRVWKRLRNTVLGLPYSEAAIVLAHCDARKLPLADGTVDFVLTSPPYINVFNYHQHYRRSVESLGWDPLMVAKSEIGSNRKHRQNRFLTVTQYCLDMAAVFQELRRVCRPEARIAIVLGRESNVRKTRFFNGEIVARLAVQSCHCRLESRQERVFQNRFGASIVEDILHFTFGSQSTVPPTAVARKTLLEAVARTPAESVADLRDAIDRIDEIESSPLYCPPGSLDATRLHRKAMSCPGLRTWKN